MNHFIVKSESVRPDIRLKTVAGKTADKDGLNEV